MTDREQAALEFLKKQLQDLETIQPHALQTTNAILAKERFHKWKIYVIGAVGEKLGPTYGKRLQIDWIETAFAGGDMYDEIADDIEMCLRQLKHLIREVGTKGLEPLPTDDAPELK
ncbi:hypothetical protein [Candidatus Nitronereus thalassa]|uniref:Uncharacterized protein n=1 Tax=Candidatus Nitronereus thalassa TaxID=3020898 RepID=A0ABU3K8I0_9BACT|nr:hypothetical protein [Candidatus Nitronereus thalassa]MDT7042643.1 hypothetical protein [Candidatus Nitronereus thalassa]